MRLAPPLLALLCACQSTNGSIRHWGTMREALRDGEVEARIDAAQVATPGTYGVGAAAGLDGEITIVDGTVHVSRVRDGRTETKTPERADATLLVVSEIAEWRRVAVAEDVAPDDVESFLTSQALAAGIDTAQPFAFMVVGHLRDLHVHVIAGQCPVRARRAGIALESPLFERRYDSVPGRLVGIYATDAGGVFTHHGSKTHVHVLVEGEHPFTGHVDRCGLAKGSELWLPTAN